MRDATPIILLFIAILVLVFLVPPSNLAVILAVTFLLSLFLSLIVKFFTNHKISTIAFIFFFIFSNLIALSILDPVNLLLGIALIIGVYALLKK